MKNFDVVIVGAGLAGLQCARLLSRQGAKRKKTAVASEKADEIDENIFAKISANRSGVFFRLARFLEAE